MLCGRYLTGASGWPAYGTHEVAEAHHKDNEQQVKQATIPILLCSDCLFDIRVSPAVTMKVLAFGVVTIRSMFCLLTRRLPGG